MIFCCILEHYLLNRGDTLLLLSDTFFLVFEDFSKLEKTGRMPDRRYISKILISQAL